MVRTTQHDILLHKLRLKMEQSTNADVIFNYIGTTPGVIDMIFAYPELLDMLKVKLNALHKEQVELIDTINDLNQKINKNHIQRRSIRTISKAKQDFVQFVAQNSSVLGVLNYITTTPGAIDMLIRYPTLLNLLNISMNKVRENIDTINTLERKLNTNPPRRSTRINNRALT